MKLTGVKDHTYIDFIKEVNDKDPKFKVDDHVTVSKYKNIFAKGYSPNWSEEVFVIGKLTQYCSKPYEPFGGDINVKVDLSNYATNRDQKYFTY